MKKLILQKIKDFLFSRKCSVCGRIVEDTGKYICKNCFNILRKKAQLKNSGDYYYLFYYEKDIKNIIAQFKFENRKNLSEELALLTKTAISQLIKEKNIDIVIPVPISKKRYRERGFNQVEELLDKLKIKYYSIEKTRDTKHMYELLDEEDRKKNIENAFKSKINIDNKNILIVDDIVTTGRTIKEIINELKKNSKPSNILVFSLAMSKVFDKIKNNKS
ncbi:MAG: ComF family protein [Fusobacteriaceae bacterium]|jgi:competence protein ComFC|nr:ComF family protein [Fusobacteriaceae bacterium]